MPDPDPLPPDPLLALVYDELRGLAARQIRREKPGHTLQPTALVHEAYLRMVGRTEPRSYRVRADFFAAAATAMRSILIDAARRKQAQKRDGGGRREVLQDATAPQPDGDLLALDELLAKLAQKDVEMAKLVELRYFGGLTGDEAAAVLGISPTTGDRRWSYARAWLRAEIAGQ